MAAIAAAAVFFILPRFGINLLGVGDENGDSSEVGDPLPKKGLEAYTLGEDELIDTTSSLDTVLELVKAGSYEKVVLQPMMIVAGDHANNDMAGDDEDTWKTAFAGAGYQEECVLKGLGEYEAIQQLLVDHVKDAVAK